MKRILLILNLVFILVGQAFAEPLWSNKKSGGDDWLLGTIHLGDESMNTLPNNVKTAIDAVDVVVLELDLSLVSPQLQQSLMMKYAMLPQGETLQQTLSSEVYQEVQNYFADSGVDIRGFSGFKPWMVALTMVQMSYSQLGLNPTNGVDQQVHAYAVKQGKKIVGLETFEQQLNFFNVIMDLYPEITGDDLIIDTLKEIEELGELPLQMIAGWKNADMALFEKIYQDTLGVTKFDKAAEKVMLVDRNHNWVAPLNTMFEEQKVLVAVGTLHFVGDSGLQHLLQNQFQLNKVQ